MDYLEASLKQGFISRLYEPMSELWHEAPPKKLWQIGKLPKDSEKRLSVAIVGSRKCSQYGSMVAYETAKKLAELGVTVVSGLALGIDAFAHKGCIDGGGQTVAVLGTPINYISPRSNYHLAEDIIAHNGMILSEYGPEEKVSAYNFVWRNRIVSGLADVVLIIEASERSGTFSTANFAINQGRSVFVVPGDITRDSSLGANRLIQQGASVFTSVEDMLSSLHSAWNKRVQSLKITKHPDDPDGIVKMLRKDSMTIDELARKLKRSVREIAAKLTYLEIDCIARVDSAGKWSLV